MSYILWFCLKIWTREKDSSVKTYIFLKIGNQALFIQMVIEFSTVAN